MTARWYPDPWPVLRPGEAVLAPHKAAGQGDAALREGARGDKREAAPLGLRPGWAAATVASLALCVLYTACAAAGWYPPWPVSWGTVMAQAGLVCWGILAAAGRGAAP